MDPLEAIREEMMQMRDDIAQLDSELSACENSPDFQADDMHYIRLSEEKRIIQENLTEVRTRLCDKAIRREADARAKKNGTYVAPVEEKKSEEKTFHPTDLVDLQGFMLAKAELAAVRRNFTDSKIHYLGLDDRVINMTEYQLLSKRIKEGEDPTTLMKGVSKTFKTAYNKKTKVYTENTVFIPAFALYPEGMFDGPDSRARRKRARLAQPTLTIADPAEPPSHADKAELSLLDID